MRRRGRPLVPAATLPQGAATTNPYAVPVVIDEAYVNRVLAGLDQAVGEVVRLVVGTKTLSAEAVDRLNVLYVGNALQLKIQVFQDDVKNQFHGYRDNPGDKITTVQRLIAVTSSCIFAAMHKDTSAVSLNPNPPLSTQWVALVPLEYYQDLEGLNPTRWAFSYDGFQQDRSEPENPCINS